MIHIIVDAIEHFRINYCDFDHRDRKGHRAKVPGNKRVRELKDQGANWPGSYWPICSRERIGPGAKRLDTHLFTMDFWSTTNKLTSSPVQLKHR